MGIAHPWSNIIHIFVGRLEDDYASPVAANADTLAHEVGHMFDLTQVDDDPEDGHPPYVDSVNPSDYCVMSYEAGSEDNIAEFDVDPPDHIHAVRDTHDGL